MPNKTQRQSPPRIAVESSSLRCAAVLLSLGAFGGRGATVWRRRWLLLALAVAAIGGILTAVVVFALPTNAQREGRKQFGPDESQPIRDIHVDKTREEMIALLGPPTKEGAWYIGLPPVEYREKYKGTQTLEWHWESGHFLASVHPADGKLVCYTSHWVPKGWIID